MAKNHTRPRCVITDDAVSPTSIYVQIFETRDGEENVWFARPYDLRTTFRENGEVLFNETKLYRKLLGRVHNGEIDYALSQNIAFYDEAIAEHVAAKTIFDFISEKKRKA